MPTVTPLPAPSMPAITISRAQFACLSLAYWALSSAVRSLPSIGPASSLESCGSDSARANMVALVAKEQFLQGDARLWGFHECFAHQKGVDLMFAHQGHVVGGQDAAFGDHALVLGYGWQQVYSVLQRGFKCAQIAVIDPQQCGVQFQGNIELAAIMDFDQDIHAQFFGQAFELAQLLWAE